MADLYLERANWVKTIVARLTFPRLRRQDFEAAQKVDYFVAISSHVQDRIRRHYHRDSRIIFPPVDSSIGAGTQTTRNSKNRDFYLVLGQLVHYKRADLAVQALNKLGRRLVLIGDGPERERIEKMAGQNIKILGWQSDEVVCEHLTSCRALVFPGEEDFGLVPVEAQMAGRPVIAYGKGGALETVIDGATGLFFSEQTPDSLAEAIKRFEIIEEKFSPEKIRALAMRFDKQVFLDEFKEFMAECLAKGKTR
jgi:glycosyltransferase involved in cell wall biosynthesis